MPEHSARAELTPAQVDGSKPELADIFRRYGEAYLQKFGASLSAAQRRVMKAIQSCRTAALGGHVEVCDRSGHQRVWYNSCFMGSISVWGLSCRYLAVS